MAKTGGLLSLILRLLGSEGTAARERPASRASATHEVDPRTARGIRMSYSPSTDGAPDPGEIVWTWVPYEENDGRGKDRPVLVVATEAGGSVLAVQLSTKDHPGFLPLGAGGWDAESRDSYVNLDRVFRVRPSGMRREAVALDRARFTRVAAALSARYGWK